LTEWLAVFERPIDAVAFGLFVLVFPVYHVVYPRLVRRLRDRTAKVRVQRITHSWLHGVLERRDHIVAIQATRNLTMGSSLLASSSLILLGFTAARILESVDDARVSAKLALLMLVFAISFSLLVNSIRYLGQFTLTIGADPAVVESEYGASLTYYAHLLERASSRYTLGVRTLHSSFPLFLWLFDPWTFLIVTALFAVKYMGFQDFAHRRPSQS